MKLTKLYAFLLSVVFLAACSNENEISWNSSEATVSMKNTELAFKENKGVVDIPFVIEGKPNGSIEVTVEVAECGDNAAMEDVHYFLTTAKVVIPANDTIGKFEIRIVDDNEINEDRTFVMTLKSANGATINADADNTVLTLKDNDSQLYERLQGRWKWTAECKDKDFGDTSWKVNIVGVDEGVEGYNKALQVTGVAEIEGSSMPLSFSYDEVTKKGYVYIPFGEFIAKDVDLGYDTPLDVKTVSFTEKNEIVLEGGIYGYWNEDCTEIVFDTDQPLYFCVFYEGQPTKLCLFECLNIKLSK